MSEWLENWGAPAEVGALRLPTSAAFAAYVANIAPHVATVTGARHSDRSIEIVTLDLRTSVPQRPAVPIQHSESLGVVFAGAEAMPLVLALRPDFPDTLHQQLVPEGCPAAICIDDRPWNEARLTWTPAELLQRIVAWFYRAARDELHDANQPVDSFFGLSPYHFIFPRSVFESGGTGAELAGATNATEDPRVVLTVPVGKLKSAPEEGRLVTMAFRVPAERMRRLRKAPTTLMSLARLMEERGVDLLDDLKARTRNWCGVDAESGRRLASNLAIIVEMPIMTPDNQPTDEIDLRAFVTSASIGEIGVALGVLYRAERDAAASRYARAVPELPSDPAKLGDLAIEIAQAHFEFDPERAAVLAGRRAEDRRAAVLVGAGAIGSHVVEFLAREGRFRWTLVDDDHLLPHNLARHTLCALDVGKTKAGAVTERLNRVFSPPGEGIASAPLAINVLHPGEKAAELDALLRRADVILDMSASVAVARALVDKDGAARRVSAFFNPAADAVVVLVEDENRTITLRDVEAQYYRTVLLEPSLERHLSAVGNRIAYTGACRAVTNRLPESRAAVLSGLAAGGLQAALDAPEAAIRIWTITSDGAVTFAKPTVAAVERCTILGWQISLDGELRRDLTAMRAEKLPSETGGALLGVVDAAAGRIELVHASRAPADSLESPALFERGIERLTEGVRALMARTMDQVRYVGEWHSHPPRHPTSPSLLDLAQLGWTSRVLAAEAMPGLMLIVGDDGVTVALGQDRARF